MFNHTLSIHELGILKSAVEGTKAVAHFHSYAGISSHIRSAYNKGLLDHDCIESLEASDLGRLLYDQFELKHERGYTNYDWSRSFHDRLRRHNDIALKHLVEH